MDIIALFSFEINMIWQNPGLYSTMGSIIFGGNDHERKKQFD